MQLLPLDRRGQRVLTVLFRAERFLDRGMQFGRVFEDLEVLSGGCELAGAGIKGSLQAEGMQKRQKVLRRLLKGRVITLIQSLMRLSLHLIRSSLIDVGVEGLCLRSSHRNIPTHLILLPRRELYHRISLRPPRRRQLPLGPRRQI